MLLVKLVLYQEVPVSVAILHSELSTEDKESHYDDNDEAEDDESDTEYDQQEEASQDENFIER